MIFTTGWLIHHTKRGQELGVRIGEWILRKWRRGEGRTDPPAEEDAM